MLSDQEKQELEKEIAALPARRSACIEGLKIVQRRRGWVDDQGIRDVAEYLGMSSAEVDGVATFYNLIHRRPVGRHIIRVCSSVSCWILGCDGILDILRQRLDVQTGGTTADGRFTLLTIQCLGTCDHAPAMMIDEETHRDLTPERIAQILEAYE